MQRMSDILTQLATHSPEGSEPSETARATNESNTQSTATVTEVNSSNTESSSTTASDPIVQLPLTPPPTSTESSANARTGQAPSEDETTSENTREV
jgi:hypothetical protein